MTIPDQLKSCQIEIIVDAGSPFRKPSTLIVIKSKFVGAIDDWHYSDGEYFTTTYETQQ